MKKNFFKKLSFVMALAMIISVIAPAAGAFAATGLRLNATTKTLFLGENNTYNFNPLGMSKGATQKWTSSKTSVATVNAKNGVVTAKAVGTTTITATITNAKKTVTKKLTAKVTVGDNIKTLSVAAPAGVDTAKLVVGTDYALATSYVTKSGAKSKTTNTFVWSVDKAGATVSKTGVFKATAPGEYTVTVTANRYKNVKVADATIKVTVLNAIKEVKQTTTNAFTVEFAGAVKAEDLTTTSAIVAQILNGKDVITGAEKVKSVKLDATGTVATVTLYADFAAKTTYKFTYGDLSSTFVAASKDLKDVAGIVLEDFNVNTTTATGSNLLDSVYAVNADGVRILNGSDISAYVTFEDTSAEKTKGYVDSSAKKAYIYTSGNSISVKATFTNYLYNTTTSKYDTITFSDSAVGVGVSEDVDTSTIQYAVGGSLPSSIAAAWAAEKTIAVGDAPATIYARYKTTTDGTSYVTTSNTTKFTYTSSDPTKLSVISNTLTALAVGTVTVIVKNADASKVVGSFEVAITPERVLATATPDLPSQTVGNNANVGEKKQIVITTLDNLGKSVTVDSATPTQISGPAGGINIAAAITSGKVTLSFDARSKAIGTHRYKIAISDAAASGNVITKDVIVDVVVVDSNSGSALTAVNYVVVVEKSSDLNGITQTSVDYTNISAAETNHVAVYAINSNGFRVDQVPTALYTADVKVAGSAVSGAALTGTFDITTSGSAIVLAKTGVYNIAATVAPVAGIVSGTTGVYGIALPVRANGVVLNVSSFTLSNSYKQVSAVKNYSVNGTTYSNVKLALDQALELTVTNGETVYNVDLTGANVTINGIAFDGTNSIHNITSNTVSAGNLYIDNVVAVIETSTGVYKQFSFDVKQSFSIK